MRLLLVVSLSLGAWLVPAWAGDSGQTGPVPGGLRVAAGEWCPAGVSPDSDHDCIVPPGLIHAVTPDYPELARRSRFTGKVEMEAVVSEFGDVIAVEVLTPNPIFEDSAVAAVKQRKYTPAYRDGMPVAVRFPITVRYGLEATRERTWPGPGSAAGDDVTVSLEDSKSLSDGTGRREDRPPGAGGTKSPR